MNLLLFVFLSSWDTRLESGKFIKVVFVTYFSVEFNYVSNLEFKFVFIFRFVVKKYFAFLAFHLRGWTNKENK